MRKYKLLPIVLILALILSSLPVFAASSNPVITVTYEKPSDAALEDNAFTQMTVTGANVSGKAILDGNVYELNTTYTLRARLKDDTGYFVEGKTLYKLNKVSEEVPSETTKEDGTVIYSGQYEYTYELVKTDEQPKSSSTVTIEHKNYKTVISEKYFVNGKETSKTTYNNNKKGGYKEKTTTKYVSDSNKTFDHADKSFLGVTEKPVTIAWSDGVKETVVKAIYNYQIDEYYNVTQQYLKTYELTTISSKPALNVKVTIRKPVVKKNTITARWKKNSSKKFKNYQVQYSTSKNFSKATIITVSKKATSKKLSKLKRKTYYYVRVRASNGSKAGPWSTTYKIKTR